MKYLATALIVIVLLIADIISDVGWMTPKHDSQWDWASSIGLLYAGIAFAIWAADENREGRDS